MLEGGLSGERAKKLIEEIAELKPGWVIIEGGEPLLRKDLFSLLELMRQKHLEVHLITNGLLLTSEVTATLKQLGVRVMISIDGARPDTYQSVRQGSDFEQVLQTARSCTQLGILEAINFTILRNNYTEIPDILELAASIGAPRVTLIGLKPCHNYPEELLTPAEYGEAVELTCRAAQKTGVEFFFDEPFFWATVKDRGLMARLPAEGAGIVVPSTTACAFGDYLFIEPDGEVKPCSFAQLVLGNVNNQPLDRIWNEALSSPWLQRIKDPKTKTGYCQSCQYLEDCKGCRSRVFALTGDWFASDPVCPLGNTAAAKGD
jgi:radical SAM protein with 4Fe4S-binding SPASM domain